MICNVLSQLCHGAKENRGARAQHPMEARASEIFFCTCGTVKLIFECQRSPQITLKSIFEVIWKIDFFITRGRLPEQTKELEIWCKNCVFRYFEVPSDMPKSRIVCNQYFDISFSSNASRKTFDLARRAGQKERWRRVLRTIWKMIIFFCACGTVKLIFEYQRSPQIT